MSACFVKPKKGRTFSPKMHTISHSSTYLTSTQYGDNLSETAPDSSQLEFQILSQIRSPGSSARNQKKKVPRLTNEKEENADDGRFVVGCLFVRRTPVGGAAFAGGVLIRNESNGERAAQLDASVSIVHELP